MSHWYVAKTKPRKERWVARSLEAMSVESYAPEIIAVKNGRRKLEALFPGYVFVHTEFGSPVWRLARWTQGISYFLPDQREPAPVGGDLVRKIRDGVVGWNNGGWQVAFSPGDRVRIDAGVLQGMDAIFQRYIPAGQRCEVLMTMMGHQHRVRVEIDSLRSTASYNALVAVGAG